MMQQLAAAGYVTPRNWEDMGSSERDLWETRMTKDLQARLQRVERMAQQYSAARAAGDIDRADALALTVVKMGDYFVSHFNTRTQ